HTRFSRDWSSDVCSSDLERRPGPGRRGRRGAPPSPLRGRHAQGAGCPALGPSAHLRPGISGPRRHGGAGRRRDRHRRRRGGRDRRFGPELDLRPARRADGPFRRPPHHARRRLRRDLAPARTFGRGRLARALIAATLFVCAAGIEETGSLAPMAELSLIGLLTAFAAGVVSFLSPCVLPLVPGYVSFVAGRSLEDLSGGDAPRLQAATLAATFVLGFTVVFVALGASATALGNLLLSYRYELGIVAGVIVILFGLHLLGLTPLGLMNREARFYVEPGGGRVANAFVLGLAFAFGWTPCIGPVLGAILTLSASTADVAKGSLLLTVYSLGLGLPFLLAALFTGTLLARLKALGRAGRNLQRAAGALLVVMGLLMVTGRLEVVAYWLLETFPALASIG